MNSIEKALAVMRGLSAPNGPHRLGDLAERSGLNRPSVHRILQILVTGNYAQAHGDGLYAAGLAMRALVVGNDASGDLASSAVSIIADLQRSTGHTVHFAVRTGDAAVYLAKVEGNKPYQMASRVGMQILLHCTSIGKAILAELPASEVGAVLERTAELQHVAQEIAPELLRRELDEITQRGYAIDDEGNETGVRCVGAAVRDATGAVIGGISISGLAMMLTLDELHSLGPVVRAAADEISHHADYSLEQAPA